MNPRGSGRKRANASASSSEYSDSRYSVETAEEQQNGNEESTYQQGGEPSRDDRSQDGYQEWSDDNYSDAPPDIEPSTGRKSRTDEAQSEIERREENDATVSESEDEDNQNEQDRLQTEEEDGGAYERESPAAYYDYQRYEENETENETEEEKTPVKRRSELETNPILQKATRLMESHGVDMGSIGYARIMGSGKGAVDYLVRKLAISIGRLGFGADCQIKSEGRLVSRLHAKLWWDDERRCWKIDCLSRIPILVNGSPLYSSASSMPLKRRSLLVIGECTLHFLLPIDTTFCINNIELLEKRIIAARTVVDPVKSVPLSAGRRKYRGSGRGRRGRGRRAWSSRGLTASGTKNAKITEAFGTTDSSAKFPKELSANRGAKEIVEEAETESESEEEESSFEILKEPQYNPRFFPPPSKKRKHTGGKTEGQSKKKRRKKGRNTEESMDEYDSSDEWSKKEKGDFARALFALGVVPIYDVNGTITKFDWSRFRRIAPLKQRDDIAITEHYRRFMADAHILLDYEEQEKKRKGPRTKHRKGCICIVCVNTAKSRQKKRESGIYGPSDDDDDEKKMLKENKLLGLVTAQKLRVRMGIHEAAKQMDGEAGQAVLSRLRNISERVKEMPKWWRQGFHDEALMKGVSLHGVSQWNEIWQDPELEAFDEMREMIRNNDEPSYRVQPTSPAVMKRVRDLANMVASEEKKLAKRRKAMRKNERRKEKRKMMQKAFVDDHPQGGFDGILTPPMEESDTGPQAETEWEEELIEEVEDDDEDMVLEWVDAEGGPQQMEQVRMEHGANQEPEQARREGESTEEEEEREDAPREFATAYATETESGSD
ncbi:hypothetical protein FGB62_34g126 [Gracilaria domingensis]|nr:hypothetical protein FGB62_34g126 [Gracilaria domingensis]